jgi:hypothetical protein
MLRTRKEEDITFKVKKVPLYHTPNKDTKIFGGYGIYNAKTNGILCSVSDTFVLNDNETLIKKVKKALRGGEFFRATYTDTIFYITITKKHTDYMSNAITICNSYDGSRGVSLTYSIYVAPYDVIIRTPVNGVFVEGDISLSDTKVEALNHYITDLKGHKLTTKEVNEVIDEHIPNKMPNRYKPVIASGRDKYMSADGPCLFVPFMAINNAINYWEMSQFEIPIKSSQLLYTQFRKILYGGN